MDSLSQTPRETPRDRRPFSYEGSPDISAYSSPLVTARFTAPLPTSPLSQPLYVGSEGAVPGGFAAQSAKRLRLLASADGITRVTSSGGSSLSHEGSSGHVETGADLVFAGASGRAPSPAPQAAAAAASRAGHGERGSVAPSR
eukprot:CAMPEP_0169470334 /NCGR_PEP_ID=MMETSP1042-20121227/23988_1 /TAXON_ID=464988 /ORGANISM="Hemiselmis andersenii, Strain CCMP1180" /LENGTH=142 /DNA_ID=CAMNT_0009583931 /DNA_START=77 /DNA_END=501 /DNA_ORIENTATION=+